MSLQKRLLRKRSADEAQVKRKDTSEEELLLFSSAETGSDVGLSNITTNSSTSSSTEEDIAGCSDSIITKSQYVTLQVPRQIATLPQVVSAADRHKMSSNALNDVLSSLIKECNGNVNDFILSTSSTLRARQATRSQEFIKIKEQY